MCGIVALINCGSTEELNSSVRRIIHRGPDNQAVKWFSENNSGLGHARLSIIDLTESGHQPMYDKMGKNWIVFNGEIFNFKDIKINLTKQGYKFSTESDTEVVLKAYHYWAEKCLDHFNGMFSFVIYNADSHTVFAARDRLGVKPFYYYHFQDKLIMASEIKSILACSAYHKEPDYNALFTPVHYQISPGTGFKGIKKLFPGHFLKFSEGKLKIEKYWDVSPCEENISYKDAFEELENLLIDSIKLQMVADVEVGSLLSGGLDSSLASVLMQKNMNQPLNTYTIKFDQDDLKRQGNVDDSYYAMKLAKQFDFKHHEITIKPDITDLLPKMVWHLDEPIADPAAINTFLISKAARDSGIKVLITGMGADEVFSGYRSHLACLKADSYQKIPSFIRKYIEAFISGIPQSNTKRDFKYIRWLKSFLSIASLPQLERSLLIKNSALSKKEFDQYFINSSDYILCPYVNNFTKLFNRHPEISYLAKICLLDTKIYLPDHNLAYSDKSMMAAGVEGRPPLIDHRIVELMFRLPDKFRIYKNTQKYILKKISEKYLPKEIIYRSKAPFSAPMRGWLKNELSEMVNDILSHEVLRARGIYNPDYVQKLIKNNNSGLEDNSQLIWRLMVNEIWFRTFFD